MSVPLADQPDSARLLHKAESNGSEEPPAAASSANGFHDMLAAPGSEPTQSRQSHHGTGSAPDPQFLNPGPSCRANKGSSSSIPYIDCSDIDSECDVTKNNRATRGHSNANDSNVDDCVYNDKHGGSSHNGGQAGSLFGVVNGFYHTNHQGLMQQHQQQGMTVLQLQQQQQQGMLGNRSTVDQSPVSNKFNVSHEQTDDEILPNGGSFHGHMPLHSTLLDEIFQGRDKRGAAVVRPLGTGTRSQCSSPVISSFHHRTNSLSHAEMTNGHIQPRSRWDDGGHYFSKRPGVVPVETPTVLPSSHLPNHYGSYSPITPNRTPPHFAKPFNNNNMRNRSDTDPFILSQLTSTPIHRHDPHRSGLHAQAPCSAPVERRMIITNGNHAGNLVVPGHARSNTVQRLFGRQGKPGNNPTRSNLNQPVQMIDGSTSSGTDTSDTESDTGSSAYSQPLMYGNPVAVSSMNSVNSNGVNSSPLPRSKFSFGSLQLEEGEDGEAEEEEGCYRFNEEDVGGRVFSC